MEISIKMENPVNFLRMKREAVLKILEESVDSLLVYQNIFLRQESTTGRDIANVFPEIGISGTSIPQLFTGKMMASRREAEREKLQRDSLYVNDIIWNLMREITEHETIRVLIDEIESITLREKQEQLLIEENEGIQTTVTELRKTIADKRTSIEKEEECSTRELTLIRDKKDKLKLFKEIEMRYVQMWEATRCEQNVLRYKLELDNLEKTLNNYHVRERNENCANSQLTRYLTWRIAFIENRIEQWQQRYSRKKKMYEEKIYKVRNEIADTQRYLKDLTTEYRNYQEFIETYLAEQEELERQREYENHVQRSTIRMQAWWRGVMVRRKLGPYRPEEKKKKRLAKTKK